MKIDNQLLEHILRLSKIELKDDEEKQKMLDDLNRILEMAHAINKLDLQYIEPFRYSDFQKLIPRDDISGKSLKQEEVLKNSKETSFPYFRVPKVIR